MLRCRPGSSTISDTLNDFVGWAKKNTLPTLQNIIVISNI